TAAWSGPGRAWRPWTWCASALTGARSGPAYGRPRKRTRVTPGWNGGWPLTGTRSSAGLRAGSIIADCSWRPRDVVRLEAPEAASVPRPGWRKRALAVRERGRWRTAHGRAPRRTGTAVGSVLAACAAVCVAVIATVMASRGHAEPGGGEGAGRAPEASHPAGEAGGAPGPDRPRNRPVWARAPRSA